MRKEVSLNRLISKISLAKKVTLWSYCDASAIRVDIKYSNKKNVHTYTTDINCNYELRNSVNKQIEDMCKTLNIEFEEIYS